MDGWDYTNSLHGYYTREYYQFLLTEYIYMHDLRLCALQRTLLLFPSLDAIIAIESIRRLHWMENI